MEMPNKMHDGVSTRTLSKDVFSTHYHGPASPEPVILDGYTEASKALFQSPSFAFKNKSSAQTWHELMDFSVDYAELGDYAVFATSSRKDAYLKEDLNKYGRVHNPDESMDRMDSWIGAATGDNAIEYVKPNPEMGLFEMPEHIPPYSKHSAMTDVNVPVKELEGTVPLNKVGFYVSKLANAYEHSRNLIFSDYPDVPGYNTETEALAEKLGDGREVTALGVENLENAAARLYYDNGTSKLVESTDIYEKAAAIAQKHGLKGKQAIDEVIKSFEKHELVHNSDHRKGLSEEQKEIYVGELLAEFFSDRAEIVDEKLARIYRKLAEENEDYAEGHRNGTLMSKIEYFSRKYAEARARGMDEDKAIKYATKSVEELEKSELEETVENEEIGEAREDAAKAEKNKEYSERKISADEDAQEQEAGQETTDDTATKEG